MNNNYMRNYMGRSTSGRLLPKGRKNYMELRALLA